MQLKVCGMKLPQNVEEVAQLPLHYLGFIFYPPSPRFMRYTLEKEDMAKIPASIKKVGVFVNEEASVIKKAIQTYSLEVIQLHGDESPEFCESISNEGVERIKVFRVGEHFNFTELVAYLPSVDYFLFDTQGGNYGGNGVAFNWELLKKYPYDTPFFLSGGIQPSDVAQIKALQLPQLYALDVNSGFEVSPGEKNIPVLHQFIEELYA